MSESLSYFVEQQFPVLAAYGKEHCIRAGDQFDIDNDALIVYKYLRAYDDGRINSLCIEGITKGGSNIMRCKHFEKDQVATTPSPHPKITYQVEKKGEKMCASDLLSLYMST